MKFSKRILLISTLCAATIIPNVASAYILPATALLRQYLVNRNKFNLQDMTLDLELSFNEDSPKDAKSLEGHFYFVSGGGMRLAVTGEDDHVYLLVEDKKIRQTNGADSLFRLFPKNDLLASLFFPGGEKIEQSMSRLNAAVKHYGINADKQSYHRYDGKVVQMIGGKATEKDSNQLWVFKENGMPAFYRLITEGFDGERHKYEIFLRNWGSPEAGNWFPAEVEYRCDGHHLVTITVQKAAKNSSLPATLFTTLQGQ